MQLTPLEAWCAQKIGSADGRLRRGELEAYQLERLRQTIQLARQKSRFYHERLATCPTELTSLDDLKAFPFTTADDLRSEGLRMLCVSQSEIERVVTLDTSGTTGTPKRLYFTRPDQELTIDFFQHGMSTFTQPGDRALILLPFQRPGSVGDLLAIGLERLGAIPVRHGAVFEPEEALKKLQQQRTNVLVGAPVNVLILARFWKAASPRGAHRPEQVLLSTDHLPRAIATALEEIWGCTVYNHYGTTEMGLGGGVECQAHGGFHLREADLLFEVIDPLTGRTINDDRMGEVVFTTLTREGMPLIRYRTGDLSRFVSQPCVCGTTLRTLEIIRERLGARLSLRAGGLTMGDLEEALFPLPGLLTFSALVNGEQQSSKTRLDRLEVTVTGLPGARGDLAAQARARLSAMPALQSALQHGALEIQVQAEKFDPSKTGSLAKRVLRDLRGGNSPPKSG